MAELWEHHRGYTLLRAYTDWFTRQSYRHLRFRGEELPEDGAVILAPNHTNTLMDALVMLAGGKDAVAFGARADIFRKPAIARILHFLRIVPMVRQRDGLEHVSENYETFVRIALKSALSRQTWLVPTGINYTDFFRYRGACEVRYGTPIDVNAFVREHEELSESQLLQALRAHLEQQMARLVEPEGPAPDIPSRLLLLLWPFAALLSLPIWAVAETLCRKVRDKAWCNTSRCMTHLLLLPLTLLLWGIVFGLTLPWYATLSLLTATLSAFPVFYDGLNLLRPFKKS